MTEEMQKDIQEFGAIVEKIVSESGVDGAALGNQILFAKDKETNATLTLGVCLIIPTKNYNPLFIRLLNSGEISYLCGIEESKEVIQLDINTVKDENLKTLHEVLMRVRDSIELACLTNYIIEHQEIISSVSKTANFINDRINKNNPDAVKTEESDEQPKITDNEPPKKKKSKTRKQIKV